MRWLSIFLLIFTGVTMSAARALGTDSGDSEVQQKLLQMERDWANAMMQNDPTVIDRVEASDYSYVMDDFKGDKQGDLDQAKTHALAGTAELSEMKVQIFGDAAVVTGKAALRNAKYNGKDVSGNYLFTDVFVNRSGRWQVVASHSNRVHAGM